MILETAVVDEGLDLILAAVRQIIGQLQLEGAR